MIDSDELRKALGQNVRRLRLAREWTQDDLAEKLEISRGQLNRIENGHHSPGAEVLFGLADAFDVPADSLRQISSPARLTTV